MKKSSYLSALAVLIGGRLALAQPPMVGPSINIQPPVPTRAHTMKQDARDAKSAPQRQPSHQPARPQPGAAPAAEAPRIHRAAADGQTESVERALRSDPTLAVRKDSSGFTPLHHAAVGGHVEVVELLLGNGARIDAFGSRGETAIFLAASAGKSEVVKLLAERGADVDRAASDGKTPLHKAAMAGDAEAVESLLQAGADPRAEDNSGRTPLQLAERYRQGEASRIIRRLQQAAP